MSHDVAPRGHRIPRRRLIVLALSAVAFALGAGLAWAESDDFALRHTDVRPPGEAYRLRGTTAAPAGAFTLRSATEAASSGSSCLCGGPIFADGFESGDTAAWQ